MATPVESVQPERAGGAVGRGKAVATLVPVLVQLALAALVIRQFHLESQIFYQVFLLAAAAFPVHALLPLRYRLPFFAAVSLAGIGLVFGIGDGAILVGAGLGLIAACHLPVRFRLRVVVVLTLGAALALARAGVVPSPIGRAVWPILGSMFMFRLALYLYALKHDPTPPTLARTLAYFFMLPNVCYPLFPVVDYTAFGRTHYDAEPIVIYDRGVKWIVRGLLHLLLYRFVYVHLSLDPAAVKGLGDLVQSLLTTFVLYLRISGQFHLVVGLLHLFGFHLPETHRLYFLASSVSDYWRRINIYWKDFMTKLVFYPSFFRLRGKGERLALAGATMVVFVTTWALHSYQRFWLRSTFPVTAQDIIFWGVLGALVVANTLWEAKRGRKRTLGTGNRRWSASLALRTVGTFCLLCFLWSWWSTDSIVDWVWMWSAATNVEARDLALVGGLLAVGLTVAGVVWDAPVAVPSGPIPFYRRPTALTATVLVVMLVASTPWAQQQTNPRVAGLVKSLQSRALNSRDAALQQQGYYENLDNRGRLSAQLWNVVEQRPADWLALSETKAYQRRDQDFLLGDLKPSSRARLSGQLVSINRWGMRDRDYTLEKPAGTRRIALLGPSYVMGMGVADDETFDAFLEARLNEGASAGHRYEVLNFGISAYSILQQMRLTEERVFTFNPDVVVITDRTRAAPPVVRHLLGVLGARVPIPYPELEAIVQRTGVRDFPGSGVPIPTNPLRQVARAVGIETRMPWREVELRLNPVADEIIAWSLRRIAAQARAHGAVPVFLGLGQVRDTAIADAPIMRIAREAGFVVFNLFDLYDGQPRELLRLAAWDEHPNPRANRMIAERLHHEFQRHEAELALGIRGSFTKGHTP